MRSIKARETFAFRLLATRHSQQYRTRPRAKITVSVGDDDRHVELAPCPHIWMQFSHPEGREQSRTPRPPTHRCPVSDPDAIIPSSSRPAAGSTFQLAGGLAPVPSPTPSRTPRGSSALQSWAFAPSPSPVRRLARVLHVHGRLRQHSNRPRGLPSSSCYARPPRASTYLPDSRPMQSRLASLVHCDDRGYRDDRGEQPTHRCTDGSASGNVRATTHFPATSTHG
jgi:hypothetical protein